MISPLSTLDILLACGVLSTFAIGFVLFAGRRIADRRAQRPVAGSRLVAASLDTPEMREKLRDLLGAYEITGDCDIRGGTVYRARRPGETNSMAAALMALYHREVGQTHNPNAGLFAVRNGVLVDTGLSLSDLYDIAQMLEDKDER